MTAVEPNQTILERDVLPTLFPPAQPEREPELVVLVGPPGAAPRRATARATDNLSRSAVLIAADVMRSFHPEFLAARITDDSVQRIDEAARGWLQSALRHGRLAGRSMILDGVTSPGVAIATGRQYREAGYRTHLVAVAAPPSKALLTLASGAADRLRSGQPVSTPHGRDYEQGAKTVRALLTTPDLGDAFTRLTVFDDRGTAVYVGSESREATEAFDSASRRSLSALESAQWLGELRRTTEFVLAQRVPLVDLIDALIEVHQIALRDVTPTLPVPPGSEVTALEERRLATSLGALKRGRPTEIIDATGPAAAPAPARGLDR